MADRINIQVVFKKALWTCPKCAQEDIEDRSVAGGDSYLHTCSKCKYLFNQSGKNMISYDGTLIYEKSVYDLKAYADIQQEKTSKFKTWLEAYKNPPEQVKPTREDIERIINDYQCLINYYKDLLTTIK